MRILFPLIALAFLPLVADAADPMADLYAGPYTIVDKEDSSVSPEILTKRPLLLMFIPRLWAVQGDTSGMAEDQNAFFKSLTELLASDAGKKLTAVGVTRTIGADQKENREAVGLTVPVVLVTGSPGSSDYEAGRALEAFIRSPLAGQVPNACQSVLVKEDGTVVGIGSLDAIKAELIK